MIHDPTEKALFPSLPEEVLAELPAYGDIADYADGEALFVEGDRDYPFFAVLEGRVKITKQFGADRQTLAIHSRGHFAGEISMLNGRPAVASGHALGSARLVRIENARFRKFAAEGSPLARMVLAAMARRSDEVEAHSRQQDKLAALGKMSAGLAHELNNPASAARRAAMLLVEALTSLRSQAIEHDCRFTESERATLRHVELELHNGNMAAPVLGALERSDLEEQMAEWLDRHGVADSWDLAPTLADAGFTVECMDTLSREIRPPALVAAIEFLEKSLRAGKLAAEVHSAANRVSELVAAMKDYTYMDRADFQDTDIHRGLESTLTIFGARLKKTSIRVDRNFAPNLPLICAHPGELNQVWTNLIDNALDAMGDTGTLTIATSPEPEGVCVEISDTGPGIPPEIQKRIFEPFFTTKPVGEGTGLGLDIVYRIIRGRHGGTVRVESKPGFTKFDVRLPFQPPKDLER
jgi:signal transduction histidine kinase